MIHFTSKLPINSGAECIVVEVNCAGTGLPKAFSKRFEQTQEFYETQCRNFELVTGRIATFHEGNYWLALFVSRKEAKDRPAMDDIKKALTALADWCISASIRSIAIPALGCLGGLPWGKVKPEIENAFEDSPAEVFVYEPL